MPSPGRVHSITVGSLSRELPLYNVAPGVTIAIFNMLGDTEIVVEIGAYDGDRELLRDAFCNHALYASILRDTDIPTEGC